MPTYEFEDAQGNPFELTMPYAEAPSIGGTVVVEGRTLTRVVRSMPATCKPRTQFHGVVLPNMGRRAGMLRPQYRDDKGRPAFSSDRQLSEYAKRAGVEVVTDGPDRCQQVVEQTERFERERRETVIRNEARARAMSVAQQGEIE